MSEHTFFNHIHRTSSVRLAETARCFLAAAPLMLIALRLFGLFTWSGLLVAATTGVGISVHLAQLIRHRQERHSRDQLIMLLEYLSARLSSGTSLERAMLEAPDQLEHISGRKAKLWLLLRQIATRLSSGQPIDPSMDLLSQNLGCPEAAVFCRSLLLLRQADAHLHSFIRSQLDMNMAVRQIIEEAVSEQAQRRTEAGLLCVMPPLMACLMRMSLQGEGTGTIEWMPAQIGLWLAFGLNSLGLILVLRILTRSSHRPDPLREPAHHQLPGRMDRLFVRFWRHIYQNWLPPGYTVPLNQALLTIHRRQIDHQTHSSSVEIEVNHFFAIKTRIALIGLTIMMVCLSAGMWPALILPLILLILQDHQIIRISRRYDDSSRQQFPVWIENLTTLLQSGLSVHRALQISSDVYLSRHLCADNPLSAILPIIRQVRQRLDLSWSSEMILREQAEHCPITEIRSTLHLISRYAHDGGSHLLELTGMQAAVCHQVQSNSLRRRLEHQSLALLLPITLQLIAVMLACATPAASALMTGF